MVRDRDGGDLSLLSFSRDLFIARSSFVACHRVADNLHIHSISTMNNLRFASLRVFPMLLSAENRSDGINRRLARGSIALPFKRA